MIELAAENWTIWVDPNYGASITGVRFKDIWVMPDRRHAGRSPVSYFHQREAFPEASFLLLPWSNRIRNGILLFEEKKYQLDRGEEHALHGEAWNRPWSVLEKTKNHVRLTFKRPASSGFPMEYKAEYTLGIRGGKVEQELTITNLSSFGFYAGLGFHPFFCKSEYTEVKVEGVRQYPMGEETGLPIGLAKQTGLTQKLAAGLRLHEDLALDDCFSISTNKAEIFWRDKHKKIELIFFGHISHLVIYNPKEPFFALEPVSHANNAFGDFELSEKKILGPKESMSIGYSISLLDLKDC